MIGDGAPVLLERALAHVGAAHTAADLMPRFSVHYGENAVRLTTVYPAVVETLTQLRDLGCRLGVCTNKPISPTRAVLAALGLDTLIEAVVGGDLLPQRKPAPEPLLAVIRALGGTPDNAVLIGDSAVDLACAEAAGVPAIIIPSGYGMAEPKATLIAAGFAELPRAIASSLGSCFRPPGCGCAASARGRRRASRCRTAAIWLSITSSVFSRVCSIFITRVGCVAVTVAEAMPPFRNAISPMKEPGPIRAMVRSPTSTETWPAAISIRAGTGAPSMVSCSPTGALCQDALLSSMPICASSRPSNSVRSRSRSSAARVHAHPLAREAQQMEQVDGDEHEIPADAGIERDAADQDEIGDLEAQPDDRGDAQPIDVGQPVRDGDDQIGDVPRRVTPRQAKPESHAPVSAIGASPRNDGNSRVYGLTDRLQVVLLMDRHMIRDDISPCDFDQLQGHVAERAAAPGCAPERSGNPAMAGAIHSLADCG